MTGLVASDRHKLAGAMQLVKIGGNELEEPAFLPELAAIVAALDEPAVIVHGGGKAISLMQERLGLQPQVVDGLRVTDAASLQVAQMVLSGDMNKRIVAALLAAGVLAAGISGVDGGLLRCRRQQHARVDLGLVGEVVAVAPRLLQALLAVGITPVVSPISLGNDGEFLNVNADEAATALAGAMGVDALTFLSNVPGVLDADGRLLGSLTAAESETLIANGVIAGGMVPKVRAGLRALAQGVGIVRIVDLGGFVVGAGTGIRG